MVIVVVFAAIPSNQAAVASKKAKDRVKVAAVVVSLIPQVFYTAHTVATRTATTVCKNFGSP